MLRVAMTQLRVVLTSSVESCLDHAADSERDMQLLHGVATIQPKVLGAADFLLKPFDDDVLLETVRAALRDSSPSRE